MSKAGETSPQLSSLSALSSTDVLLPSLLPPSAAALLPPPPPPLPPEQTATAPEVAAPDPTTTPFGISVATAELLARMSDAGSGWDQARSHVLSTIVTSDNLPPLPPPRAAGRGRGRPRGSGRRRGTTGAAAAAPATPDADTALPNGLNGPPLPPPLTLGKRPRGRPKGSVGRKKRRLENSDDDDADDVNDRVSDRRFDFDSDDDEVNGYGTADGSFLGRTPRSDGSDSRGGRLGAAPLKTKSGRRVLRPSHFVPVMASPVAARQGRRGRGRPVADASLCKKCERGNSPNNNVVVFCDGCGAAYHQFCHDPPIARDVVDIPEKEWNCLDCSLSGGGTAAYGVTGLMPGLNMSMEEKRSALESTPFQKVVDILLYLSSQYPHLALFPKDPSDFSLPSSALPPTENGVHRSNERHYDGYETDPPQHYPKPGSGLSSTLPPEAADEPWLVDDNLDAFNHVTYEVPPGPVFASAADIAASALRGMGINGSSPLPTLVNGQASGGASPG